MSDRSRTNEGVKSVSECTKYTISEADVQQLHMVSDTPETHSSPGSVCDRCAEGWA